jgi:ribosome-binding factor A
MAAARAKSRFANLGLGGRPKRRPERVADLIKAEIAMMLIRKMKDPRVHPAVITRVRVTDDLRHARVFYTVAGGASPEDVGKGLESAKGFIRSALARTLEMRYVPTIQFKLDLSVKYQTDMERLLQEIAEENDS